MTDTTPARADGKLTVALISEVYWEADGVQRLKERLAEAADRGADLAVLPEIPLNPLEPRDEGGPATTTPRAWTGSGRAPRPRRRPRPASAWWAASSTATSADGGRVVRWSSTARGSCEARTRSCTCPRSPASGRRATTSRAREAPQRIDAFGIPIGVQLCSDANRPQGSQLLGAQGVMAVLNPRASEERTLQRWKTVWRANAMTSCCYVLSVNRPYPERGVLLGGPSVAYDPNGDLLLETTDTLAPVIRSTRRS